MCGYFNCCHILKLKLGLFMVISNFNVICIKYRSVIIVISTYSQSNSQVRYIDLWFSGGCQELLGD